jgi:hypothetical protein
LKKSKNAFEDPLLFAQLGDIAAQEEQRDKFNSVEDGSSFVAENLMGDWGQIGRNLGRSQTPDSPVKPEMKVQQHIAIHAQ